MKIAASLVVWQSLDALTFGAFALLYPSLVPAAERNPGVLALVGSVGVPGFVVFRIAAAVVLAYGVTRFPSGKVHALALVAIAAGVLGAVSNLAALVEIR